MRQAKNPGDYPWSKGRMRVIAGPVTLLERWDGEAGGSGDFRCDIAQR